MILSANPRMRSRSLRVGERLIIPMSGRIVPASAWSVPPESPRYRHASRGGSVSRAESHRVQPGETASGIARRYGISLDALLDYNDMNKSDQLRAGRILKFPPR